MLTNPLKPLSVSLRQLVFQNRQKVSNDIQSFREKRDALIHFEVISHCLINGIELRLSPHQFGRV